MPGLIEDYALLGDLQTAALVGRDDGIDWLSLPRFDSPAWPATRRRYREGTLIMESEWDTPDGTVRLVDRMPPRGEAADVVRVVEGVSGRVTMRMLLRLRFDYGHIAPWVQSQDHGLAAVAGPDAVSLHGAVPLSVENGSATAGFSVRAGERLSFVLTHSLSHRPQPAPVNAERAVADTEALWTDWISRCSYQGSWQAEVRRALITLKALTYAPTGGIVAAATQRRPA